VLFAGVAKPAEVKDLVVNTKRAVSRGKAYTYE